MKLLLENWRQYLNENNSLGRFGDHKVVQASAKDPFGGGETMVYSVIDPEGETKATLQVVPHEDGVRVKYAKKEPDAGFYMTEFYKWLLDHVGVLYSDPSQSPAGTKIWTRLQQDNSVNVEEYDMPGGMMGGWKVSKK